MKVEKMKFLLAWELFYLKNKNATQMSGIQLDRNFLKNLFLCLALDKGFSHFSTNAVTELFGRRLEEVG